MKRLKSILDRAVRDGVFPGACAAVARAGEDGWAFASGRTRLDGRGETVTPDTLFDLASLTKVLLTTSAVARMVDRGELGLDEPAGGVLTELSWNPGFGEIRIRDLLAHQAGFEAWIDLRGDAPPGSPAARENALRKIVSSAPVYKPRTETKYSDLGFVLLGEILARKTGRTLHALFETEVGALIPPHSFCVRPLLEHPGCRVAATEDVAHRGGVLQGDVHDGNAWVLGGLAGHAGLFGTAADCARAAFLWLEAFERGNLFLRKAAAEEFFASVPAPKGEARALGWDRPAAQASQAGSLVSPGAVGHLGYTGTSVWVDPGRRAVAVLLTNRVHPTSKNEKIKAFRPLFYDAVWEELD